MIFGRKVYLDYLTSCEGNGMIKIITGIRRCGKSFLLFTLYKQLLLERGISADHIIELNLEDRRNKRLRDPDALLEWIDRKMEDNSSIRSSTDKYYILLDEVQLVPEFEDVLNSYLHVPNAEVFVTGSNAKFLSKDVITEFRGRGWEIRVRPLSFQEYYEAKGGEKDERLMEYYRYGGLPGAALLNSSEEKEAYLKEVFETVYLKDVVQRNHLRNADGLQVLVRVLASGMGSSMNVRKIANTFKTEAGMDISANTISKYLEHLEDAFIISEALRYNVKGRKYIGTDTKYYFEDMGVRNAVLGFRQVEETHAMENVLYNELCRRHYQVDVGQVDIWGKDAEGKTCKKQLEVDFVVNRFSERVYIQSALRISDHEKEQQEQASLLNINDAFKKVIIVGGYHIPHYNENGVHVIGLYDLLLKDVEL